MLKGTQKCIFIRALQHPPILDIGNIIRTSVQIRGYVRRKQNRACLLYTSRRAGTDKVAAIATDGSGIRAEIDVRIIVPIAECWMMTPTATIHAGSTVKLLVNGRPGNATLHAPTDFTWESSDESVATVEMCIRDSLSPVFERETENRVIEVVLDASAWTRSGARVRVYEDSADEAVSFAGGYETYEGYRDDILDNDAGKSLGDDFATFCPGCAIDG